MHSTRRPEQYHRSDVTLGELDPPDREAISRWPSYKTPYEELDYALRGPGGWLYTFGAKPDCVKYGAYVEGELVGFCLLDRSSEDAAKLARSSPPHCSSEKAAEFYVAIHPDRLNKGYGKAVTLETLRRGFQELHSHRIFLKVRKNHDIGIRLYESIGFAKFGECTKTINGKDVAFYMMQITASDCSTRYGQ